MNTGICDICSVGCGHICSLDYGESFCPVCLPERETVNSNNAFRKPQRAQRKE